jgi:CheY-like chemotaxis protein
MRLICVKTLRAEGFTVFEAEGSSEALEILATHQEPIDLLLTDLMLPPPGFQLTSNKTSYPRVHGHEVIQRTLTMKRTTRVILMSSLSEQERMAYRLVTDQVPFLKKPFSVETLVGLVHTVLAAPPLSCADSVTNSIAKQDVKWYG